MDLSQFQSNSEGKQTPDSYYNDLISRKENIMRQLPVIVTSHSYSRGQTQEYTEVDLLSECSTPVSYVPGRFLQLCDIDAEIEEDAKIWPVSKRPALSDLDVNLQLSRTNDGYSQNQSIWKSSRQNLASSKLVTIAVCFIVALTALGGLVAFV
ncbi:unnamed protein product [Candidula unifasciata]|uniref:Uncharacterized protein n=1 Tax=Candidula unifasciata TaxID=100452 RepID=A0A8S3YKN8_9EUPU|nr:unnamed protein product [Candidula unifasciata]